MSFAIDPRGDLPPPMSFSRATDRNHEYRRRSATTSEQPPKPRRHRRPCHDWIFSSASNVHVAVDRSSFKEYTSFRSYVLAVADQREVYVRGVGTVELNIRSHPASQECHVIELENVLHVPSWICNIFSDVYFSPPTSFEHTWTESGVCFMKRTEDGTLRSWGFTEEFCGLEKLALAKDHRGRSPMLEDKDREVFSINVSWPQGQADRFEASLHHDGTRQDERRCLEEVPGNIPRASHHAGRRPKTFLA